MDTNNIASVLENKEDPDVLGENEVFAEQKKQQPHNENKIFEADLESDKNEANVDALFNDDAEESVNKDSEINQKQTEELCSTANENEFVIHAPSTNVKTSQDHTDDNAEGIFENGKENSSNIQENNFDETDTKRVNKDLANKITKSEEGQEKLVETLDKNNSIEKDSAEILQDKIERDKSADLFSNIKIEQNNQGSTETLIKPEESFDNHIEPRAEMSVVKEIPKQIPQLHTVLIPAYSYWFDLEKINDREQSELPEFFIKETKDKSKTPVYYKIVRNFIVNTYRINPNEKITFLSIRRNLTGDAGSLLRIFKFLEKWGLINYQVKYAPTEEAEVIDELDEESDTISKVASKILGKNLVPEDTNHFKVSSDAPKGLYPFKSYKPSINVQDLDYLKNIIKTKNGDTNFDISASVKRLLKRNSDPLDGSEESLKKKQKIESKWTNEEYSRLMELFFFFSKGGTSQIHQSQWLKISQEINSMPENKIQKTATDCILKFLQVPIDDDFLLENKNTGILKYAPYLNGLGIEGAMGNSNNVANPILETLTTLISYVDIKQLQEVLDYLKEKKQKANADQVNENEKSENNFNQLVNLGFTSLAIRADKMALNEHANFISEMSSLIEINIKKINLKIKKNSVLEALRAKEIEKLEKERLDFKLDKLRVNQGLVSLKQKYNADNINDELFRELSDLINKNCEYEKKESENASILTESVETASFNGGSNINNQITDDDNIPISVLNPSKYRYWSA
ncbi:hypothetical protein QEN19_002839 [Hanseniaspora menglaensis]